MNIQYFTLTNNQSNPTFSYTLTATTVLSTESNYKSVETYNMFSDYQYIIPRSTVFKLQVTTYLSFLPNAIADFSGNFLAGVLPSQG